MKKTLLYFTGSFILLLFIGISFFSCKKETYNEQLPTTNLVSATFYKSDSVLLTANITSTGAGGSIAYYGFAYSTDSATFTILSNQILFQGSVSGNFQARIYADPDSTYFFRAFAANGVGYKASNILKYSTAAVTVPCTDTMNTLNEGSGQGLQFYSNNVDTITNTTGNIWTIKAPSNGPTVTFTFGSKLTSGIYKTSASSSPGSGQVYISFAAGLNSGTLNAGSSVYVNTIGTNTYDISICSAPWVSSFTSTTYYFNSRLTAAVY